MQIVKFGGSLYYQPALLRAWLQTLSADARDELFVLVPGGGPFADLIRNAQRDFALSDVQAHKLAIDAMCQFGRLLLTMCDKAQPFDLATPPPLSGTGLQIWLPDIDRLNQTSLAKDWSVTSDSIALWLAQQYQQPLTLLKSVSQFGASLQQLTADGHIDNAFRPIYLDSPVPLRLLSANAADGSDRHDWTLFDD